MALTAIVTAGGTSEPIDDVRVITNLSSGRFGAAIASALCAQGVATTLMGSRSLLSHPDWFDSRCTTVPFRSFLDLDAALRVAAPPDLLFMVAAVSDYSPVPAAGKIRSTAETITITLRRNPKILTTLRARYGRDALLVGFKLLSGVSGEELVDTAHKQILGADLDLCVANDLQLLGAEHPIALVRRDGSHIPIRGTKAEVASKLVDVVLQEHAGRVAR